MHILFTFYIRKIKETSKELSETEKINFYDVCIRKVDKVKYLGLVNSIFDIIIGNTHLRTIQTEVGTGITYTAEFSDPKIDSSLFYVQTT